MNSAKILIIRSATVSFLTAIEKIKKNFNGELYLYTKDIDDKENKNFKKVIINNSNNKFSLKNAKKDLKKQKFDIAFALYNNKYGNGYYNIDEIAVNFSNKAYSINNLIEIKKIKQSYSKKLKNNLLSILSFSLKIFSIMIYIVFYILIFGNKNE